MTRWRELRTENGFTLAEMLIVVMIIGILAAIAVPQYIKVVERDKATEALDLLLTFKGAQDRYLAKYGDFCKDTIANCPGFDITPPTLKYFKPLIAFSGVAGPSNPWLLVMTRDDPAPALYGNYTITYNAGATPSLSCSPSCPDLLPAP